MTEINGTDDTACPSWDPPANALYLDRFGDGTDGRRIVLLATHPTCAYVGEAPDSGDGFEANLSRLAFCYLENLEPRFKALGTNEEFLPDEWMQALDPDETTNPAMMWLRLDSSAAIASRDLKRGDDDDDRTIVLVAGQDLKLSVGSFEVPPNGFGVRVVMRRLTKGQDTFAISSMTAHLADSQYDDLVEVTNLKILENKGEKYRFRLAFPNLYNFLTEDEDTLRSKIAAATGQDPIGLVMTELRVTEVEDNNIQGVEFITYGRKTSLLPRNFQSGQEPWPPDGRENEGFTAITTRFRFDDLENSVTIGECQLHAHVRVPVFAQVPTALKNLQNVPPYEFRPRPSDDLHDVRKEVTIRKELQRAAFRVRYCPGFVLADKKLTDPVKGSKDAAESYEVVLPPNGAEIDPRSDLQSAISAYYHFDCFFKDVHALELNHDSLLRYLKLPIMIHYRSGISPGRGKDGQTVNARVALTVDRTPTITPMKAIIAHVHLALGNMNRGFRDVPDDGAFEARALQQLGIANDRRWILHEISHLLIAGALGELELRFVHSVGDALAAVLCDPDSRVSLADPDGPWEDFRFQTFPWVDVQRRHDRSVLTGWSWSGAMHRDVLQTPELQLCGLKGYDSEQILSTTLFRLYRILGGDTVDSHGAPDVDRRRAASRVVLYLVLRGLETFVHWPLRAEELESALIDADVCLTTCLRHGKKPIWVGGQAHKAIRWAFEAQGLHPEDTKYANNGPGAPPPVDIYVKDGRDDIEHTFAGNIDHKAGSYVPVSLHLSDDADWTPVISYEYGDLELLGFKQ